MKEENESFFDQFADSYRTAHTKSIQSFSGEDSFYFAEYKVKELMRYEGDADLKLLDFGCGDGVTELYFEKHFPGFKLYGIDVSEKSIVNASGMALKNTSFQWFDGNVIPYSDAVFDIVFTAGVLHHIDRELHQTVLSEIYRVLKPQGRFYVFEHNPLNPFTRYLVKTCEFDIGVKLLSSNSSRSLLKKAGFQIMNLDFTIFFPRKKIFKPFIGLERYLKGIPLGGQYFFRALKP